MGAPSGPLREEEGEEEKEEEEEEEEEEGDFLTGSVGQ